MIFAETDYRSIPTLLAAYAPQYKKEHFHIHGGWHHNSSEDTLLSIFKDDTNQLHQAARRMIKGAVIGGISAVYYHLMFGAKQTEFTHTRNILNKLNNAKRYPAFMTIGALAGLSWWVIHDMFLCPHGKESSINRYVLAHAIQGGLLTATLYHPAAFGYGMIAGGALGLFLDALAPTKLPKNFMVYFKNFDEQKRRNKLRDDEEYELSLRSVLHEKRTFHPI